MRVHPHAQKVLLIDDQQLAADLVLHMLQDQDDIDFQYLAESASALETALAISPTVVLVDLRMPSVDGFGVIRMLRSHGATRQLPIILLSSEDSPEVKVQAFAEGADDYLVKWPDKRELVARIRYHSSAYLAHRQRDEAFLSLQRSQEELLVRTQELAQSQAALHQAQKMEAVGQLTGGVAHDFNNVLQVISGNLQLLKLITEGDETAQRRIDAAFAGVERGAKLSAQLLAFARRQPLQSVVINAGSLLREMEELLRCSLGDLVKVELLVEDGLWNTTADPSQLENVILNLAINARDAMSGEGSLTVRAFNAAIGDKSAESAESPGGGFVAIEVADSGTGMPPEVLQRAFEPFFTTKPAGQGTGLGLSMAYGFVKQSGGHIELESEVGKGTMVRFFLPRAAGDAARNQAPVNQPVCGGVETILVVEDEPDVRATTVELLNNLGYLTLQAEDAASALQLIESGAKVDLLFTDVVMPGPTSSVVLAERAKAILPGLQVLFASGNSEGIIAHQGAVDPQLNLLRKPYTVDTLAEKIRYLLQGRNRAGQAH